MKKQLVIIAAAVTGLITYLILRQKYFNPIKPLEFNKKPVSGEHHRTNVFAKAKKRATG